MLMMSVKAHSHVSDQAICHSESHVFAASNDHISAHHDNATHFEPPSVELGIKCLDSVVCLENSVLAPNPSKRRLLREILSQNVQEFKVLLQLFDHFYALKSVDEARDPPKSYLDKISTAQVSWSLVHLPTILLTI